MKSVTFPQVPCVTLKNIKLDEGEIRSLSFDRYPFWRVKVLWTIWNFSMVSAEKVPVSLDFCHHRGSEWISPAQAPRAKAIEAIEATNEECFSSEITVFLYNLYYHEFCLIKKLALDKLNRTEQLLDCKANSKVIIIEGIHKIALQSKDPGQSICA